MKKIKGLLVTLSFLGCFLLLIGCNNTEDEQKLDRAGMAFDMPEDVNRIVSLAPSITTILIDLGLQDNIIAMDSNSVWDLGNPNDVPVFDMLAPEVETILSLNPDLIFVSGMTLQGNVENDPFAEVRSLGISIVYIPSSETILNIKEDILFIASVVGEESKGEQIVYEMEEELAAIANMIGDERPTVYFEISPSPEMFSFGTGVFLNEMIELAGGVNVFSDHAGWLSVEAESILSANPDVIFTNVDWTENAVDELLNRSGWSSISAIETNRVFQIGQDITSQATHRIVAGIRAMAEAIHN